jgi:glycosyltransferase involved in cell wall biosynthesis
MKVAMVTPVYPPYKGGIGAVAAQYTADLKTLGVQVTVMVPHYPGRPLDTKSVTALRPWFSIGNAAVVPQLLFRLREFDFAHLHYTFYGADIFVWLWSVIWRKPYVLTYHMRPQTQDWRNLIFKLHRYWLEPMIVRRARVVLVSSLDYARSINLQHSQLLELPFGVDHARFKPGQDQHMRQRYDIQPAACVFIFVGKLDAAHVFKGVDVLLQAVSQLTGDWRLLVVGDGDRRGVYEHVAKTLGIIDRVLFVGEVTDDDLPKMYQAADVHVLPSTSQSEAFGLVTLEAAASGLPSIVANLPGVRTLVTPGKTGDLVEPGNYQALATVMQTYVNDLKRAREYGLCARRRIEAHYTHAVLAERLLEVYKNVIT